MRELKVKNGLKLVAFIILLMVFACTLNEEIDSSLESEKGGNVTVVGSLEDYAPISSVIEAENFTTQLGIQTENTKDTGGGENVGYIDVGDFLTYNINVPVSGLYSINFRIASRRNAIKFAVYSGTTLLTNIETTSTRGWQTWKTLTETVELSAGDQELKIVATGNAWNINWLEFILEEASNEIPLNLRVHLMRSDPWVHASGVAMESWVTANDVNQTIIPELNNLWSQTNIIWNVESIIEEPINAFNGFQDSVDFVISTARDSEGRSDPDRLPHLYDLMQPTYKSTTTELGTNLFHIYLFPFIGNTSQGNAMSGFDYHSVVGTWSNKHNGGGNPERTLLTEDQDDFVRGSLSRTIAHELGHVIGLAHSQCSGCLMQGNGYGLTEEQIEISETEAKERL